MSTLRVGVRCYIEGLQARSDLNGKTAKLISWADDAGRWAVEVAGTKEGVRVKPANLKPVRSAQATPTATTTTEDEEEEDSGVYVHARINGEKVAIDPKHLKQQFQKVVTRYSLDRGSKSDAIADFLTSSEKESVTAEEFAERFGTSEEDASIFLAWVNVGIAFKEQYMDPNQEEADKIARQREETGVI